MGFYYCNAIGVQAQSMLRPANVRQSDLCHPEPMCTAGGRVFWVHCAAQASTPRYYSADKVCRTARLSRLCF